MERLAGALSPDMRWVGCEQATMRRAAMPAVQELVGHQDLTMTYFLQA